MGARYGDEPATQSTGAEGPRLEEEPDASFLQEIAWHCRTFAQGFQFAATWHALFMITITCLCTFLCSKGILDFSFDISMGIVAVGTVLPLVFSVQVRRLAPPRRSGFPTMLAFVHPARRGSVLPEMFPHRLLLLPCGARASYPTTPPAPPLLPPSSSSSFSTTSSSSSFSTTSSSSHQPPGFCTSGPRSD